MKNGNDREEGPPEPFNIWEEYFDDFDRQLEESPSIAVRRRIGNPKIRPADDIPESEMEEELDKLIELLYVNNIVIDFIHDIGNREAYIFIVEELLDETMEDIRIPGMYIHFIYEEFHQMTRMILRCGQGYFWILFSKKGQKGFLSQSEIKSYMMWMEILSARKS